MQHCDCTTDNNAPPSHLFCPSCTTLSSDPSWFLIHLMPCCCGSMMSGQRSLVVRMAAFSIDILSFGKPWLCQAATVASSVSMRTGSRPSVRGTETWNRNTGVTSLWSKHSWRCTPVHRLTKTEGCYLKCVAYFQRPKERNPLVVKKLHTVPAGKVTHIRHKRRSEEDITTQSFLLLFELDNFQGPALLLWL